LLIRTLRLTNLLSEVKQARLLFSTLSAMSGPFISMLTSLYIVFFVYVQVGQYLYSGDVTIQSPDMDHSIPDLYYLLNFNDFGAGMITMFHILVVNNWWVTCTMYE